MWCVCMRACTRTQEGCGHSFATFASRCCSHSHLQHVSWVFVFVHALEHKRGVDIHLQHLPRASLCKYICNICRGLLDVHAFHICCDSVCGHTLAAFVVDFLRCAHVCVHTFEHRRGTGIHLQRLPRAGAWTYMQHLSWALMCVCVCLCTRSNT